MSALILEAFRIIIITSSITSAISSICIGIFILKFYNIFYIFLYNYIAEDIYKYIFLDLRFCHCSVTRIWCFWIGFYWRQNPLYIFITFYNRIMFVDKRVCSPFQKLPNFMSHIGCTRYEALTFGSRHRSMFAQIRKERWDIKTQKSNGNELCES